MRAKCEGVRAWPFKRRIDVHEIVIREFRSIHFIHNRGEFKVLRKISEITFFGMMPGSMAEAIQRRAFEAKWKSRKMMRTALFPLLT